MISKSSSWTTTKMKVYTIWRPLEKAVLRLATSWRSRGSTSTVDPPQKIKLRVSVRITLTTPKSSTRAKLPSHKSASFTASLKTPISTWRLLISWLWMASKSTCSTTIPMATVQGPEAMDLLLSKSSTTTWLAFSRSSWRIYPHSCMDTRWDVLSSTLSYWTIPTWSFKVSSSRLLSLIWQSTSRSIKPGRTKRTLWLTFSNLSLCKALSL